MFNEGIQLFLSFFSALSFWGVALALLFSGIWSVPFWPPIAKDYKIWLICLCSALLTTAAICFVQNPIQILVGDVWIKFLQPFHLAIETYIVPMPAMLTSGIVQELTKLTPVAIYWHSKRRGLSPKTLLAIGAMSGAGFGFFEARWVLDEIFAFGWHRGLVVEDGILSLLGFIERFFAVGSHIAWTSLAAYGLGKNKWYVWLMSVIFIHSFVNYFAVLYWKGIINLIDTEIVVASSCCICAAFAIRLRWKGI